MGLCHRWRCNCCDTYSTLVFIAILNFRRAYRIPLEQRYILNDVIVDCMVRKDGFRKFIQKKTYLFFRPPSNEDLFDNQLTSIELDYANLEYYSPDSQVIDVERTSEFLFKVFWEPKAGEIAMGVPYTHEFSCLYPRQKINASDVNFITFATSCYVRNTRIRVSSERDIVKAVAYRKRFGQSLKRADSIAEFASKVTRPLAPPPTLISKNEIEWRHDDIRAGEIYYIVTFYASN